MRTFRTGLLIGLAIAAAVAAATITYERYDTKTLKRTIRRDAVEWVHVSPFHRVRGKPRSTVEVAGSGQRDVTTLPRV